MLPFEVCGHSQPNMAPNELLTTHSYFDFCTAQAYLAPFRGNSHMLHTDGRSYGQTYTVLVVIGVSLKDAPQSVYDAHVGPAEIQQLEDAK